MSFLYLYSQNIESSVLLGLLFTFLFFLFSLFLVVGIKICLLYLLKQSPYDKKKPAQTTRRRIRKKNTEIPLLQTIEIDPEKIDRIYVKRN